MTAAITYLVATFLIAGALFFAMAFGALSTQYVDTPPMLRHRKLRDGAWLSFIMAILLAMSAIVLLVLK